MTNQVIIYLMFIRNSLVIVGVGVFFGGMFKIIRLLKEIKALLIKREEK